MKVVTFALLVVFASPVLGTDKGTVPRSAAWKYAAHAEADGASIGAVLLKPQEVRKTFSTDLTRCCQVVEVALYPAKDKPLEVSDFVLRSAGSDSAVKSSSPKLLAAQLQKRYANSGVVTPVGEVHVGYESGIDPATGQRVQGVESGLGMGVGIGGGPGVNPASTERDREVMEMELTDKGLPNETASAALAGYLYFELPRDNKKASHQLECTLNGHKVSLKLN